jgi:mono/diheme cytochrome c family protein
LPNIPDFTDESWQKSHTDHDISLAIHEGKSKTMPAMKHKLSPESVEQLVSFVRGFRRSRASRTEHAGPTEGDRTKSRASAGPATETPTSKPSAPDSTPRRETVNIFERNCASCHGRDGKGTPAAAALTPRPPNFTDKTWQSTRTQIQLIVSILEGKGSRMPAFRGKLSGPQARELAAYIRRFGPSSVEGTSSADSGFDDRFDGLMKEMSNLRREYDEVKTGQGKR